MTDIQTLPSGYPELLERLKTRIHASQVRAAMAVSRKMVLLYWSIGKDILARQGAEGWGARVIDRLAHDLQVEFPGVEGFSARTLKYMRALAEAPSTSSTSPAPTSYPSARAASSSAHPTASSKTVAGGWSLNYLYTYSSGQPFTVYCNQQTTAFFGCYANRVPGQSLYSGSHNQTQWLNPAAFTNPAVFQTGQSGLAALGGGGQQARGPSFNNLDASLFKEFPIAEQFRLQFRAEAFNVANHPQFGNPGNLDFGNSSSFGLITGTRALPRLYQFA